MRKQRDISAVCKGEQSADRRDRRPVGAFAIGTTVPKDIPTRPVLSDVPREPAFIVAVVPFRQVRFNLRRYPQSGQLASPSSPLQRAGEDAGKLDVSEPRNEGARFILTVRGQGKVRPTGVLAG